MLAKAKSLLSICLVLLVHQLSAQNLTRSPYSALGFGEMQFTGSAAMHGMGQISQGMRLPFNINNQNPASYGALRYTTWDAAGIGSIGTVSSQSSSTGVNTGSFAYLALGVPLHQKFKWGMSMGLMPYSSVGYNIKRTVTTSTFTGTENIEGRGGISRFYIGSGIRVYKNISVGVDASYLYGQVKHSLLLDIPREYNMYNLIENRDRYIGDLAFNYGVQMGDTFRNKNEDTYRWGVGLTFSPQTNLTATDNYNVRTLAVGNNTGGGLGKDTVAQSEEREGTVTLPNMLKFGVYYSKIDAWSIGADFGYQAWENYKAFGTRDSLKNMLSVNIGGSFIPDASDVKHYLKRVEYRAGFRFDNGSLDLGEGSINTMAVSAGMGFPLVSPSKRTWARLNIAAEYMIRGTTDYKLVKEEYFRFVIGVSISDEWFRQYRYD